MKQNNDSKIADKKVRFYKSQHLGELPEQKEANFRTLEMLQRQMETISGNLEKVRDRQTFLRRKQIIIV